MACVDEVDRLAAEMHAAGIAQTEVARRNFRAVFATEPSFRVHRAGCDYCRTVEPDDPYDPEATRSAHYRGMSLASRAVRTNAARARRRKKAADIIDAANAPAQRRAIGWPIPGKGSHATQT